MFHDNILKLLASRHFLPVVICGFVLSRLLAIILLPVTPISDEAWYIARAIDLADGRGYVQGGFPTAYWPVGYPAFVGLLYSIFGKHLVVALLANVTAGALTLVLIDRLSQVLFHNVLVGHLAVLLYTLSLNQLAYTLTPQTEILFTFLLMAAILLFIEVRRDWQFIFAGIVFGLATLVKIQTVIFPFFVIGLWAFSYRKSISSFRLARVFIIVYTMVFLVVIPWSVRNYLAFDSFVLISTNGGAALYVGNSPNATGRHIPDEAIPANIRPRPGNEIETDKALRLAALEWIKEHPLEAIKLIPLKIWYLWARDGEGEWSFQAGYSRYDDFRWVFRALRILNQLFYFTIVVLFLAATVKLARRPSEESPWVWLSPVLVLYTTLISVVFSGQSRYHFPVVPWMIMLASWLVLQWIERKQSDRQQYGYNRQRLSTR